MCVLYYTVLSVQEEEESLSTEQAASSQPTEPQPAPAQAPRKHYRNREHFATIRTASLVRTCLILSFIALTAVTGRVLQKALLAVGSVGLF